MQQPASELTLRLRNGSELVVPASLDSVTTYILLEQEAWFEKELAFLLHWLRPGMNAIDIGANLGVYAIPITRAVGPGGRVFAYEPASEPRGYLERSRARNSAVHLDICPFALSDGSRESHLSIGHSSEYSALGGDGGERVHVTSLDEEDRHRAWPPIDVIKIDAEGEEERIIAGGRAFFARHSPLVMFEIRVGNTVNQALRGAFLPLGYSSFRVLPDVPLLVPDDPNEDVDGFEVNLFAAKPDLVASLASEGLLLRDVQNWTPDAAARECGLALLREQPFAAAFPGLYGGAGLDPGYRDALAGYAVWRSPDVAMPARYAALNVAYRLMRTLCQSRPVTLARLSTFARVAWEAGWRGYAAGALRTLAAMAGKGNLNLAEPFWPARSSFDAINPGAAAVEWFMVSALEQLERSLYFSSRFGATGVEFDRLCRSSFASVEMERRRVLVAARAGQRVAVPVRLRTPSPEHINADIWRAGLVPNTLAGD